MIPCTSRSRLLAAGGGAIILIISFTNFCPARGGESTSITWRDDYGAALEEAKAANKPIWIQFTGPWCPSCIRMEQDSFPQPIIVRHGRDSFVPVKLRSDVHEQLAHEFNLTALPSTIVVSPGREIVALHVGYLGPAELDVFLRDSLARLPAKPARARPESSIEKPAPKAEAEKRSAASEKPNSRSTHEEDIALEGYCPVSLVKERKLVAGKNELSARHDGRRYRFASPAMLEAFRRAGPVRARQQRFVPGDATGAGGFRSGQSSGGRALQGSFVSFCDRR